MHRVARVGRGRIYEFDHVAHSAHCHGHRYLQITSCLLHGRSVQPRNILLAGIFHKLNTGVVEQVLP